MYITNRFIIKCDHIAFAQRNIKPLDYFLAYYYHLTLYSLSSQLFMVALCNRETIYIFMLWFVLSFFFFFLA